MKYINRWGLYRQSIGDSWDRFDYIRRAKKIHKVSIFSQEEVKQLINHSSGWTPEDIRNNTMLILALNCGLRRSEMANLKIEHIHRDYLEVALGKGEKDRDVPLDQDSYTWNAIQKYLPYRSSPNSPYLFVTRKGKINVDYMGRIAAQIRKKTGMNFAWHKARHTYATTLVREGVNILSVSMILGHEDIQTTYDFYLSYNQENAFQDFLRKKPKLFKGD